MRRDVWHQCRRGDSDARLFHLVLPLGGIYSIASFFHQMACLTALGLVIGCLIEFLFVLATPIAELHLSVAVWHENVRHGAELHN